MNAKRTASVCLIGLVGVVALAAVARAEEAPVTVTAVRAPATVTRADKTTAACTQGMSLGRGDALAVGPGGQVDLKMGDGNTIRLTGGSSFRVGETTDAGPTFDLLSGDLLGKLAKLPPHARTTIRTPTGVAGVEGTTFRVHVAETTQATEVNVVAGAVRLASVGEKDKYVTVGARQSATSVKWPDAVLRETGTGIGGPPEDAPAEAGKAVLVVSAAAFLRRGVADPEAVAEAEARANALAILADRLARRRVDGDQTLGALVLEREGTVEKVIAFASQARTTQRERTDDGRLRVTLELDLAGLEDLVGRTARAFAGTIREIDRVAYGQAFGGQARLMAEAAARQDAHRRLVERIHGVVVDATTTVRDLAAESDVIQMRTTGLLRGARPIATRYFSDGSIEVDVEVAGQDFLAALDPQNQKFGTHYLTTPERVSLAAFLMFYGFAD